MGGAAMTYSLVDFADVQGLVRFAYKNLAKACYALVRIRNVPAARAWLRSVPVSNAVKLDSPPTTALQVAFTAEGLRELGVPEALIEGFSREFTAGMNREYRARTLGDVASNAPDYWYWGGPSSEPHLLVMFFAEPGRFDSFLEGLMGDAWRDAFTVLHRLETEIPDKDKREPFGFADGLSQPKIDWTLTRDPPRTQYDYSNEVALGEFLLGYRNEYGKFTDRPVLDADAVNADLLLPAVDAPEKRDLGRNGTYLVIRQLEQDVRGFWQFVYHQAGGDPAEAEKLAAAMVGRNRDGTPLVPIQEKPIPGIDPNDAPHNRFTFDQDRAGVLCPFGAHVRRANPRNADFSVRPANLLKKILAVLGLGRADFRDDLISSVRFHRILRRGRAYGPELTPEEALTAAPPNEPDRGLVFVCLNANIARQFEFVQSAWMASTKFSGLTDESDPLLGNRQPIPECPVTSNFTLQRDGSLRRRVTGLPQFVTVRGGAYFFLPSLRALRYLAGAGEK